MMVRTSETREFRWGILGSGAIAKSFARDLSYFNNHLVQAVGSRSIASANDFAIEFPGCIPYGSYAELVADKSIDAIYVATPHPQHVANTLLALNAGKAVLCEKPLAVNAIEVQAMVAASRENGVALLEAMWTRFLPHIAQLRELIGSGTIGQVEKIVADAGQFLLDSENPRIIEPALAGGALLDLGIYPISFVQMILGTPTNIIATAKMIDSGVDGDNAATFNYVDGVHALISSSITTNTSCSATVTGTLGRIELDRNFSNPTNMRVILNNGTTTEFANEYIGHGLRESAAELERMVRNSELESPLLTHQESISIMQSLDEIRAQIGLKYPFEV
jgi:predicted dehydrogenase